MLFFLSDLVTYYNSISSQDIDVSAILQIEFPLENTSLWKEKHFEAPNSKFWIFRRGRAAIGGENIVSKFQPLTNLSPLRILKLARSDK